MYLRPAAAAPLDAFVDALWASEREALPHARERLLPDGRDSLVIALHDAPLRRFANAADAVGSSFGHALWQGVHEQPLLRDTAAASCVVGVTFKPGGAAALAGVPMHELAGRTVALGQLWGHAPVSSLRERLLDEADAAARLALLEDWLLKRLARMDTHDAVLAQLLRRMGAHPGEVRIDALCREAGCSPRRLIERFRAGVGLAPKRYARVLRFQALLPALAGAPRAALAGIALDAGYADQAHLGNEFRRLAGLSPRAYRAVDAGRWAHVAEPAARDGA